MIQQFKAYLFIKEPKLLPVYADRRAHRREDLPAIHSHEFYELIYVIHGKAEHIFDGTSYDIHAGDILLIRPGESHTYKLPPGRTLDIIMCLFLPDLLEPEWLRLLDPRGAIPAFLRRPFLTREEAFHPRISLTKEQGARVEQLMAGIMQELEHKYTDYATLVRMQAYELLLTLNGYYEEEVFRQNQSPPERVSERVIMVRRVRQYLEENYEQKIDLELIAETYGISPRHLNRIFSQDTGITITEMTHRIRIEKAKRLLAQTNEKIVDIAAMVGYDNPSFFNKLFIRKVHCSPSDYRKSNVTSGPT